MAMSRELRDFPAGPGKSCGRCNMRADCRGIAWWERAEKFCCRANPGWSSACALKLRECSFEAGAFGWKSINIGALQILTIINR